MFAKPTTSFLENEARLTPAPCDYSNFTIIIPTLNEAGNIVHLIQQILASYAGINILVVDDESSDGTAALVRAEANKYPSGVGVLERKTPRDRGITASVLEGILSCRTKYFVVMDGDFQHPPTLVADLRVKLLEGNDLVIASRVSVPADYSAIRRWGSVMATTAARFVLKKQKIEVVDPLSGCFGAERQIIVALANKNQQNFIRGGYKILFDLLKIIAATDKYRSSKFRVAEVTYDFATRSTGRSKFRLTHALLFCRSLFRRCQAVNK